VNLIDAAPDALTDVSLTGPTPDEFGTAIDGSKSAAVSNDVQRFTPGAAHRVAKSAVPPPGVLTMMVTFTLVEAAICVPTPRQESV